MTKNRRRQLMENQMLERAAELFARRGFKGTTLQDIAESMNISRPALYHYFSSKEELLAELVKGLTQETADNLHQIAMSDMPPAKKLTQAISSTATRVAGHPARFRLLALSENDLPDYLAAEHQEGREAAMQSLTAIVQEAIQAGAARPMDAEVASFAILGACYWTAWWVQGRPDMHPDQYAVALANTILSGVLFERGEPRTIEQALTDIQENVRFLQCHIPAPAKEKQMRKRPKRAEASDSGVDKGARRRSSGVPVVSE